MNGEVKHVFCEGELPQQMSNQRDVASCGLQPTNSHCFLYQEKRGLESHGCLCLCCQWLHVPLWPSALGLLYDQEVTDSFGLQCKYKVVFTTRCLIHSVQVGGRRTKGQKFPSFHLLLLLRHALEETCLCTLHVLGHLPGPKIICLKKD